MEIQKLDELISIICEILDTHLSSDSILQEKAYIMNEVQR